MKTQLKVALYFLLLLHTVACKQDSQVDIADIQTTISPNLTPTPYIFKTSKPDTATIHGHLLVVDPLITVPDPKTPDPIFLVPIASQDIVTTIPTFEIGNVPRAEVDETTGKFAFTNITPGRYLIMVIILGGSQIPVRDYDTGNLAIVTIKNDDLGQTLELDPLTIP